MMIFLPLQIAIKFYRGLISENLTAFISWITVISITGSITIAIVTLSVINGFMYEFSKRILSIIPHIELQAVNNVFIDWSKILVLIRQLPNIIYANFYIQVSGVIEHNNMWHVIYIRSIDTTENVIFVNELIKYINCNDWKYFCDHKNQIILGKGVADFLNIKKDDWITILIARFSEMQKQPILLKKIRVQVSAILNLHSQLDQNLAIMSFQDIQLYCQNIVDTDGIVIQINDIFYSDKISRKIKKIVSDHVCIKTWMDTYGYIFRDIQMIKTIIYLFMIFIICISCFNIISTLIIAIKNKYYDIAILYMLGANKILIRKIFFIYGFIIYVISSIAGVFFGILISYYIIYLNNKSNSWLNEKILTEGIYFIDFLPVYLHIWDILKVLIVTYLIGFLSIWYASIKTDKIKFSQLLR